MKHENRICAVLVLICFAIFAFLLVGCNPPKKMQTNAIGGYIDSAEIKVESIYDDGALPKSPIALSAIKDLKSAKAEIASLNNGISVLEDVAKHALAQKDALEGDFKKAKEDADAYHKKANKAIWDRNWLILGLGGALLTSGLWIFRKPLSSLLSIIVGVVRKVLGAW